LGVAVTKPRQPLGSFFQPLLGTGLPLPQSMPKKLTRMASMLPASGLGVGVGTGDGEGDGASAGAVTGGGARGAGAPIGPGRLGASSISV
jgi:hypothetical protein